MGIWSILLFVCGAQSLFLAIVFIIKPPANKHSAALLLALLGIILCTTVSNLWSSTYLYRTVPQIAGFARGMVLLLGPVLLLYVSSILNPRFHFRKIQLLHFIPYIAGLIIIKIENVSVSYPVIIHNIDQLMEGTVPINKPTVLWFVAYFIHLLVYIVIARRNILRSIQQPAEEYLIPVQQRVAWLKRMTMIFALIAVLFLGHSIIILINGTASIITNYIYNLVLAIIVYMIGFQAIADNRLLSPGFAAKYRSNKVNDELKNSLVPGLLRLFEQEKVFTEPELSLAGLAKKLDVHPNILSQVINHRFNQSFNELLNFYRIEEFKKRIHLPEYSSYSIIGLAYVVGYNSKSSFNTAFKKQTGITPSEYLRSGTNNQTISL